MVSIPLHRLKIQTKIPRNLASSEIVPFNFEPTKRGWYMLYKSAATREWVVKRSRGGYERPTVTCQKFADAIATYLIMTEKLVSR